MEAWWEVSGKEQKTASFGLEWADMAGNPGWTEVASLYPFDNAAYLRLKRANVSSVEHSSYRLLNHRRE
jgi:hypothetical protein